MAGQRTLNPYVLVRLQCPQPEQNEEILLNLLVYYFQEQLILFVKSVITGVIFLNKKQLP